MNNLIVYPREDGGIVVVIPNPSSPFTIKEIAQKDTPFGLPYKVMDRSNFPTDLYFREAWEMDFSNPDGHGIGIEAWNAQHQEAQ